MDNSKIKKQLTQSKDRVILYENELISKKNQIEYLREKKENLLLELNGDSNAKNRRETIEQETYWDQLPGVKQLLNGKEMN